MNPRFFKPGRIVRRVIRRNVRRRFMRRRARRWLVGGAVLLAIAGTHRSVKLREDDARTLEQHYGRPVDQLTESEIDQGMQYHNIQPLTIDESDRKRIYDDDSQYEGFQSSGANYCMHCGVMVESNSKFCSSCGQRI
ncbi:MAG: zinc ribbon domain-containing protein [Candidatus Heimdallarchaeota archaeon]